MRSKMEDRRQVLLYGFDTLPTLTREVTLNHTHIYIHFSQGLSAHPMVYGTASKLNKKEERRFGLRLRLKIWARLLEVVCCFFIEM
jgi:hypothetical protein